MLRQQVAPFYGLNAMACLPTRKPADVLTRVLDARRVVKGFQQHVAYYGVDIGVDAAFAWARLLARPVARMQGHRMLKPKLQRARRPDPVVPALVHEGMSTGLPGLCDWISFDLAEGRGIVLGFEAPMWSAGPVGMAPPVLQGRFHYEWSGGVQGTRSHYCWTMPVAAQQTVKALAIGRALCAALAGRSGRACRFTCARTQPPQSQEIALFEGYFTGETGLLRPMASTPKSARAWLASNGDPSPMSVWPPRGRAGRSDRNRWDAYATAIAGYLFVNQITGPLVGPARATYHLEAFLPGAHGVSGGDVSHWDTIVAAAGVGPVGCCPVLTVAEPVPPQSPTSTPLAPVPRTLPMTR